MKQGDMVRFIGVPCARTEEAGVKKGQVLTLNKMFGQGRWTCHDCDIVFAEGDLEKI